MDRRGFLLSGAALAAASATLTLPAGPAAAAPRADLWERWTAHDPASTATIDHGAWGAFLSHYLRRDRQGVNRIPYGEIEAADRELLKGYIDRNMALPISRYSRAEQKAYWANLYNALTVEVVLTFYPVESIRDIDISPGLFADGPWGKPLLRIEGEEVSLDDIEHRILRPIWRDPRIHYAVNCASIGCPNLLPRPFTGANSETLLDRAARAFVNHPRGVTVEDDEALASSIYFWFEEDFGDSEEGILAHLRQYASGSLSTRLAAVSGVGDAGYDWTLNDATRDRAVGGSDNGDVASRSRRGGSGFFSR